MDAERRDQASGARQEVAVRDWTDAGAAAEYVVGCVAAVGFAITMLKLLVSPATQGLLWRLLERALPWM